MARPRSVAHPLAAVLDRQRGAMSFVELIVIFSVIIVVVAAGAKYFSERTANKYREAGNAAQGLDVQVP